METQIKAGGGNQIVITHRGNLIIIDCQQESGQHVRCEANADEVLNAIKAHYAMSKTK